MLKKSEVLREGYLKGIQKASETISKMILEATLGNVDFVKLNIFIENKLNEEIVFDDYETLKDLEEAGDLVGVFETISREASEEFELPNDESLLKHVERISKEYLEEAYGEKMH